MNYVFLLTPRLINTVSSFPTCNEVHSHFLGMRHHILKGGAYLEKEGEHRVLNEHAAQLEPELVACESWLRCHIEGIEADQLLIRFSHLDEANVDREFSFVLDVSTPSYNGRFLPCL